MISRIWVYTKRKTMCTLFLRSSKMAESCFEPETQRRDLTVTCVDIVETSRWHRNAISWTPFRIPDVSPENKVRFRFRLLDETKESPFSSGSCSANDYFHTRALYGVCIHIYCTDEWNLYNLFFLNIDIPHILIKHIVFIYICSEVVICTPLVCEAYILPRSITISPVSLFIL